MLLNSILAFTVSALCATASSAAAAATASSASSALSASSASASSDKTCGGAPSGGSASRFLFIDEFTNNRTFADISKKIPGLLAEETNHVACVFPRSQFFLRAKQRQDLRGAMVHFMLDDFAAATQEANAAPFVKSKNATFQLFAYENFVNILPALGQNGKFNLAPAKRSEKYAPPSAVLSFYAIVTGKTSKSHDADVKVKDAAYAWSLLTGEIASELYNTKAPTNSGTILVIQANSVEETQGYMNKFPSVLAGLSDVQIHGAINFAPFTSAL